MPTTKNELVEPDVTSWSYLSAAIPQLEMVLQYAKNLKVHRHFCANDIFRTEIEPWVRTLVGSDSKYNREELSCYDNFLGSDDALESAAKFIYQALPDCSACNCVKRKKG